MPPYRRSNFSYTYLSFLSVFLICLLTATLEKNRQEKYTYLSFLDSIVAVGARGNTDKKNTYPFVFFVSFNHPPSYRYSAKNRQEKYTYLLIYLPTSTSAKTDKKNTPICFYCLFFSSALCNIQTIKYAVRANHSLSLSSCYSRLPSYWNIKKYRQKIKRDGIKTLNMELSSYLSFSSAFQLVQQEKPTRKKKGGIKA